ncbi:MAG: hypothetical protein FJY56_08705 [Betaproteobacteria bacterium]|nr:hypothetical protein [Betaproteobacteria bacterium]
MAKRGKAALTICSTAFKTLGRAQASALGRQDLPIAVMPHPFGLRKREEVREIAAKVVDDIAQLVSKSGAK